MSPSSPGVPGGEPEPAHPYQQRLGAVSDPVPLGIPSRPPQGAAGAVHHPAPLTWPGTVPSARRGDGGAGTAGLRPHIRCTLGLIPIPLPQPRRVGWRGCSRVCRWGRAWSPTPGGSAGPCPSVGAVSRDATCPGRWGCWGTGACSLPVLPVPTPLPAFLPGCSFSEFLGRVATANSLFLARVICTRWLCRVPTAGLRGVRCPPGTLLPAAVAPLAPALLGAWQAPAGTRAQPCDVPRSLLVSEEMRSLIVEKGPGPVEEDPDALVKGRRSATGFFFLPHPRVHSWG